MTNKTYDNQLSNRRVARNTIFLYVRMVVVMLISFYSTRVLLSHLGVLDYGVYNVVCGFVGMFSFLNTSMANGVQRFYNVEIGKNGSENIPKIFSHAFAIQMAIAFIILLFAESFGLWYLHNEIVVPDGRLDAAFWVFQFSLFSLLIVILTVPFSAAVMAYEYMDFFAFVSIIDAVLKLVIVLLLPYLYGDSLVLYGFLYSLISVVNLLLNSLYCKIKIPSIRYFKVGDRRLLGSLLSFSGWNILGSLAHMGKVQGVNLVLNSFWGTIVNTAFGISSQITAAVSSLLSGFLTAVRPQMIKSYSSGDLDRTMKMLYTSSKLTFYLVMILSVPLLGELKTILDFWLGPGKYPELTVPFAQLTILTILADSFATPISIIVHASGKMRDFQIICSTIVISVVPLSYIVAKMGYPSTGVVLMGVFVTIITQLARLVLIKNIISFSIKLYMKKVFIPTFSVFFLSIISAYTIGTLLFQEETIVFLRMFFSFIVSIFFIYFFGLSQSEKILARSILKK